MSIPFGYDNLTANDRRKEAIDSLLLLLLLLLLVLVLREGSALDVNLSGNISTKLCLHLNDESELAREF
ncbi:hypothetical protein GCM10027406_06980 [Leifsonia lichenia]